MFSLHKTMSGDGNVRIPGFDKCFDRIISHPDMHPLFIAEEDGSRVGVAQCNRIETLEIGCASLNVNDLVVVEEARGKKVGSLLMDYIHDYAIENGYESIELLQPSSDSEGHLERTKFYTSHGFLTLGPGRVKSLRDDLVIDNE